MILIRIRRRVTFYSYFSRLFFFAYFPLIITLFIVFFIDAEVLKREEEAIKIDDLNVAQMKELRDKVTN